MALIYTIHLLHEYQCQAHTKFKLQILLLWWFQTNVHSHGTAKRPHEKGRCLVRLLARTQKWEHMAWREMGSVYCGSSFLSAFTPTDTLLWSSSCCELAPYSKCRDLPLCSVGSVVVNSSRLSLHLCPQQTTGNQLHLWGTAAIAVPQEVRSQVSQQQFRAAVQQVEHILCQSLHWWVAHFFQVKNVLQKVQHLVLKDRKWI